MVVEVSAIETTPRARAFLILSAILIAFGVLQNYEMISAGIAILVFLACVRSYMLVVAMALEKCSVEIPAIASVEGERICVEILFKNPTLIPIAFAEVSIRYSSFLKLVEGVRAALIAIPPRSFAAIRMCFLARIGMHRIGPVDVVARDLLGLYRFRKSFGSAGFLRGVPRVSEAEIRRLLLFTRSTGLTRSRRSGYGTEFFGVREYREGDDVRRIVWKYFASKRRLVVKELELETMNRILFIVDGTSEMVSGPYAQTPFEHSIRTVASIARYLSYRGDYMGIIIASNNELLFMSSLDRGRKGYMRLLETISRYRFEEANTSKVEKFTRRNSVLKAFEKALEILPREKSIVFIFTSHGDEEYLETLVGIATKLSLLGNEVFLVIPITTTFEVKGVPQWGQAIYRLKVFERTKKELEFVKKLRSRGAKVIAVGAEHIPQIIVSLIESMKPS